MVHYFKSLVLALLLSMGFGSVGQAASFDRNKPTTEAKMRALTSALSLFFILFCQSAFSGVDKGIDVRRVQTILTELCYNPGLTDGAWGRKTEAAISDYFSDIDQTYSGDLTSEIYGQLSKRAASRCDSKLSKHVIHYDNFSNKLSRKYFRNQIPKCRGQCQGYNAIKYDNEGEDRFIKLSSREGQMSVRNAGDQVWNKDRVKLAIELPFKDKKIKDRQIWYGFRAKFPEGKRSIQTQNITFTELHQIEKSKGNKHTCTDGMFWRVNFENKLRTWVAVTSGSGKKFKKRMFGFPLLTDEWATFKIGIQFSENDGFLTLFRNGKEIYRYEGDTYNILWSNNKKCTNGEPLRYLLQIGVYRGIKFSMTPTDYAEKVDTIFFDDFIISEVERDVDFVLK